MVNGKGLWSLELCTLNLELCAFTKFKVQSTKYKVQKAKGQRPFLPSTIYHSLCAGLTVYPRLLCYNSPREEQLRAGQELRFLTNFNSRKFAHDRT